MAIPEKPARSHQRPEQLHRKAIAANVRHVHPHIVRLYAIERHENVLFLIMEYLEGMSQTTKVAGGKRRQNSSWPKEPSTSKITGQHQQQSTVLHLELEPPFSSSASLGGSCCIVYLTCRSTS